MNSTSRKYNYVFYISSAGYYEPFFHGLNALDGVKVIPSHFEELSEIEKKHTAGRFSDNSRKFARLSNHLKAKKAFNEMYKSAHFDSDAPICFVFSEPFYILLNNGYAEYIKKMNPKNKIVVQLFDLYDKKLKQLAWFKNISEMFGIIDLITSYSPTDAAKHNLTYFKEMMAAPLTAVTTPQSFDSDLFFLGRAKERQSLLIEIAKHLHQEGIRCNFNIIEANQDQQISVPGVRYIGHVDYRKQVKMMQESKCILEIIQEGSDIHTLRTAEAVCYKRKLLTNNQNLATDNDIYNPAQMRIFDSVNDIDLNFLRLSNNYISFKSADDWSPKQRMLRLECLL